MRQRGVWPGGFFTQRNCRFPNRPDVGAQQEGGRNIGYLHHPRHIDSTEPTGIFVRDFFDCGVNERSEHYPSADAALIAARAAYKGPDMKGGGMPGLGRA